MSDPKQNLRDLRDLIAGLPAARFDMAQWGSGEAYEKAGLDENALNHDCGTAGCIGGWAAAMMRAAGYAPDEVGQEEVERYLGLGDAGNQLFLPPGYTITGRYTQADAISALDHLIETGEVKWPSKTEAA